MEQVYPTYYPCTTPEEWKELNAKASDQLGYADENALTYSMPIIDKNGVNHFIVNQEVVELVDLNKCIEFDKIEFSNEI
jgi:hypothetical protein